jgi:hypothetical protein
MDGAEWKKKALRGIEKTFGKKAAEQIVKKIMQKKQNERASNWREIDLREVEP